jgi:hypothetical protein
MSKQASRRSGVGDFDFFVGTWDVVNHRLLKPLTGSTEWVTIPATAVCHGVLFDGAANLDEIRFPTEGFTGLTLRLYEPESDQWSLNWVNSRTGRLTPPVVGSFDEQGIGRFEGDDTHDGRPIRCRFLWSGITPTAARWEQAFSDDGGHTWEDNWVMEFSRVGPIPAAAGDRG